MEGVGDFQASAPPEAEPVRMDSEETIRYWFPAKSKAILAAVA